jgi:D-alanyl-D-alanine carboxypeptidase
MKIALVHPPRRSELDRYRARSTHALRARGRSRWLVAQVLTAAMLGLMLLAACSASHRSDERGQTTTAPVDAQGFDPRLRQVLQRILDKESRRFAAHGASAAIVVPGEGIWTGATGIADRRTKEPVTEQTVFAIGSVTKTFIAALVLDLAEHNFLRLDDPLARWMPRFPRSRQITIRQLLNHTSGVFDVTENSAYLEAQFANRHERWTPTRTLSYVGEPRFAPGSDWGYSNTNYILLGVVIERATGASVASELRRRLLEVAGAQAVFLQGEEDVRGPVAPAYYDFDFDGDADALSDGTTNIPSTALASAAWTAGGIAATPEAVARFGDALFRGRLLEADSLAQMLDFSAKLGVGRGGGLGYGFGVARFEIPGHEVFGHGGGIPGYRSALWHAPEHGVTIAFSWNETQLDPTLVVQPLLDAVVEHIEER